MRINLLEPILEGRKIGVFRISHVEDRASQTFIDSVQLVAGGGATAIDSLRSVQDTSPEKIGVDDINDEITNTDTDITDVDSSDKGEEDNRSTDGEDNQSRDRGGDTSRNRGSVSALLRYPEQ